MPDIVGKTVGGYPIEKLLSKVSYGELYQATTSAAPLAVRLLREDLRGDAALNAAVAKGFEAARAVTHVNLVTSYGAGVEPGLGAYCLEELIRGRALRQIILDGSKMAWRDCLIVAEQIFTALNALHTAKVFHGDLWTAGVLITQDQDLKLEGAGGLMSLDRRVTDVVHGQSLGYQAPEILKGSPISAGSDIYSGGACLHFILAGHDPYPPEPAEALAQTVATKKLARVTALRDDLPPEADEFIARLMAHDPTQRYGAAADVLADIGRLKDGAPLGPLKGGVAAKPPQFQSKSKSNAEARAVNPGSSSGGIPGRRSGVGPAVGMPQRAGASGQQKKISGFPAAVSSQHLASGTRVFGRLDTHVKSTIPQSDTERRGVDLYRQGQLPLALGCWREAFETTPHTGLKVKLELGERDLKKEAYNIAMDEARHRMHTGDFAGAIGRAQEALISADNEQQKHDALTLETQASEGLEKDLKASKIKMMIGGGALVLLVVIASYFIFGRGNPKPPEPEEKGPVVGPTKSTGTPAKEEPSLFALPVVNASILRYPSWKSFESGLAGYTPGTREPVVKLIAAKMTETTQAEAFKNFQLSIGEQYKDPKLLEATEFAFSVGSLTDSQSYSVDKLVFRYTTKDNVPGIICIYLIDGPGHTLYVTYFEGNEAGFTTTLRDEADKMMRGWKFK